MNVFSLRMTDGTHIVLPSSLDAITTYVLLEQEAWFEKETAFLARWLKRGMNAIDIGANLGVYSLPMARMVGPSGHIHAYEPASETRRFLEASKKKNRAANLHIIAAALSDSSREGHLVLGASSELNTLEGSGAGEAVQITSLDAEQKIRNWGTIDFIKIDAEGEEERILDGGRTFFLQQSPLVMFEVKVADKFSESLLSEFVARDYGLYRLLGGEPILVPVDSKAPIDSYELNFFAAKPDRASALAKDGLLVDTMPRWSVSDAARTAALPLIRAQAFGPTFAQLLNDDVALDPTYLDALAAYAAWRANDLPLPERYAALHAACTTLTALCERDPSLARLSTLARIGLELGYRTVSVNALRSLADLLKQGTGRMEEPFWPANPRFDKISPGQHVMEWFVVSALEQFERSASHSSMFGGSGVDLDWLRQQPFVSAEIERRSILMLALRGQPMPVPKRLMTSAPDHINSDKWRAGLVPNTTAHRS